MTSESDIQAQILDWLRAQFPGAFIRKLPVSAMIVGGGRRVPSPLKGMPDILMILEGKYIGIECKRPGMKNRSDQEEQREVHQWLRDAGGTVYVVSSLEELQRDMGKHRTD